MLHISSIKTLSFAQPKVVLSGTFIHSIGVNVSKPKFL